MEHARTPVKKSPNFSSWWKAIQKFWGKKQGKAILLGAAAVIVAAVILLVCLFWPSTPLAVGNNGLAVQMGSTIYYANANDQNRLYAMKTDGSGNHQVLAETIGGMVTDGTNLYAFINDEYRYLWTLNLENRSRSLLMDTAAAEMGYSNQYLYYTDFNKDKTLYSLYISDTNVHTQLTFLPTYDLSSDGNNVYFRYGRDGDYVLCSVPLAGGDVTVILSKQVLDVVYYEGKLYYIDQQRNFCSVNPDGSQDQVISEIPCSNLVIFEDQLYFIHNGEAEEEDAGSLCRMNLDGSGYEVLAQGSYNNINVVENRVFFLDNNRQMYYYDIQHRTVGRV